MKHRISGGLCRDALCRCKRNTEGDREYYYEALDEHFPGMKKRYIERYGNSYELPSPRAAELTELFQRFCKENGIISNPGDCFKYMYNLPDKYVQMSIFDI